MKQIGASDFKARCLAILDEVARTGEPVQVLKRGKVVARLVPALETAAEHPQSTLAGSVTILGDVLGPAVPEEDLDAVTGCELRKSSPRARRPARSR
jgi:prevent-host-death family protein